MHHLPIMLTLYGVVPSKKNAWKRPRTGGKAYLPSQIQADIDALVIQAQSLRHKLDLSSISGKVLVRVHADFYDTGMNPDLDNAFTTLLDVLQKAGIIQNDRMVRAFAVEEHLVEEEKLTSGPYVNIGIGLKSL